MSSCASCGRAGAAEHNPGRGLCFDCFRERVDALCRELDETPAARLDAVYQRGMAELGASVSEDTEQPGQSRACRPVPP